MQKIMRPEQVPPVGSVVYYELDGHRGCSWSIVVHTEGFGAARHVYGADDVFKGGTYSTIGCYHADDPDRWPDEVVVAVAKWKLTHAD